MKRRADAGFTLVELLVAIALLGMLSALAYGSVRFGSAAWRRTAEFRQAETDREAIAVLFRHAIMTANPAFQTADYADRRVTFSGGPDELRLIAPLPQAIEPGVMAWLRFYRGGQGSEARDFRVGWALDLAAPDGTQLRQQATVLAETVAALRFDYFGATKDGDPAAWHDRWTDLDRLPELVRLRIWRSHSREDRPWLDDTAETSITTNADCIYVPGEALCRRLQ